MLNIRLDGVWLQGRIWTIWTSDRIWTIDNDPFRSPSRRLTVVAYPEGDVMFAISKLALFERTDRANCSQNYFARLRRGRCDMPLPMCWDCKYDESEPWKRTRHGMSYGECVSTLVAAQDGPLMARVFASNMRYEFYANDKHGGPKQLRVGSGCRPVGYTSVMIDTPNVFDVEMLLNSEEKASLATFLAASQALKCSMSEYGAAKQD